MIIDFLLIAIVAVLAWKLRQVVMQIGYLRSYIAEQRIVNEHWTDALQMLVAVKNRDKQTFEQLLQDIEAGDPEDSFELIREAVRRI